MPVLLSREQTRDRGTRLAGVPPTSLSCDKLFGLKLHYPTQHWASLSRFCMLCSAALNHTFHQVITFQLCSD